MLELLSDALMIAMHMQPAHKAPTRHEFPPQTLPRSRSRWLSRAWAKS